MDLLRPVSTTDPPAILAAMASRATERLCDAVIVLYVRENGFAKLALAHHRDERKNSGMHALWERAALTNIAWSTSFRVAQSQRSSVVRNLRHLAECDADLQYRTWVRGLVEQTGLESAVIVPMRAEGRASGVIAFLRSGSEPILPLDVHLFEEAGRETCAALAARF